MADTNAHSPSHNHGQHTRQVILFSLIILSLLVATIARFVDLKTTPGQTFLFLFLFRYVKLVVNTISWALAKPYTLAKTPKYKPRDVSVIIPSANPSGSEFLDTVLSALASGAAKVIIVSFGTQNMKSARTCCEFITDPRLFIIDNGRGNKRSQMMRGVEEVRTPITVFCDDHVFWPQGFLHSILAPFEDPTMGGVGTHKRVHRVYNKSWCQDFVNFLGCIYLERHNAEILATNRLDGGVFIISSRTAAYRTSILKDPVFNREFLHEYIWFGRVGPLNADDDNFIMRWLVTKDWKIWIQNGSDALMETTINNPWRKFRGQLLRWVRTTWRSNPRSLFEGKIIYTQPWSLYATYFSLFHNFALLWDPVLLIILHRAISGQFHYSYAMVAMVIWILSSKMVKLTPHMLRNPRDLMWFPGYVCFAYFHSIIKFIALCTFDDISWGSRTNVEDSTKPVTLLLSSDSAKLE